MYVYTPNRQIRVQQAPPLDDLIEGVKLASGIYEFDAPSPRPTNNETDFESGRKNFKEKFLAKYADDIARYGGADAKVKMLGFEVLLLELPLLAPIKNLLGFAQKAVGKEVDGKPQLPHVDSYAVYDALTKTVWIVIRGTQTIMDMITNLSWMVMSCEFFNLSFPLFAFDRAKKLLDNAISFIKDELVAHGIPIERVGFTGHSLGGGLAVNAYLQYMCGDYHVISPNGQEAKVFVTTVNAPLVLNIVHKGQPLTTATEQNGFSMVGRKPRDDYDIDLDELGKNVFNLTQRFDIVSRMLGPHDISGDFLKLHEKFGEFLLDILEKMSVKREHHVPFGHYFHVTPGFDEKIRTENSAPAKLYHIHEPVKLLSCWPRLQSAEEAIYWVFAGNYDHNSATVLAALCTLRSLAVGMLNTTPVMGGLLLNPPASKTPSVVVVTKKPTSTPGRKGCCTRAITKMVINAAAEPVAVKADPSGGPVVVNSTLLDANGNRIVVGTDSTAAASAGLKQPRGAEWKGLNPTGLTANLSDLCITPNEVLAKNLSEGEVVLREFDCYFPGHFLPRWYLWSMIIASAGLYLLVLAYRAFLRWLYRNRCCTPDVVKFQRGKMAVTNKGRLICYYIEAVQKKVERSGFMCIFQCCCRETCAAPVIYAGELVTRVYTTKNIRQISQHYASEALCCNFLAEEGLGGCCCIDYECGLLVTFDQFDHADTDYNGHFNITTKTSNAYVKLVRGLMGVFSIGRRLTSNGKSGISPDGIAPGSFDHKLYVLSNTMDLMFDGDVHNVVDHLCDLHKAFVEVLPETPDILSRNADFETGKVRSKLSFSEKFVGTKVVYDTGEINIPSKWLTLQPNEEVITTSGQVYYLTFWDWVLSVITLGYWYCTEVRKKKFARTAIVVTNKRIIEMILYQRTGEVPFNLANVNARLTSYYPNKIKSGIFVSSGHISRGCVFNNVQNLRCAIDTDGGMIEFWFYTGVDAMYFAKALTMVPSREATFKKPPLFPAEFVGEDLGEITRGLLPLLPGEKVHCNVRSINKFSLSDFQRFCPVGDGQLASAIISLAGLPSTTTHYCSPESLDLCWPWLPYFLTCCLRPFMKQDHLLVTDTAVMSFKSIRNYGLCGFRPIDGMEATLCGQQEMWFTKQGDFELAWAPIENLYGHNFGVRFAGAEDWHTRICKNWFCGKLFCPLGLAYYELSADMGPFEYLVSGRAPNHNYYKDSTIADLLLLFNNIETSIHTVAPAVATAEPIAIVATPIPIKLEDADWATSKRMDR